MDEADHIATVQVSEEPDAEYSVDVAGYLASHWDELDGQVSFVIKNITDRYDQKGKLDLYSRESGKGPQLWTASKSVVLQSFAVDQSEVTMWPGVSRQLSWSYTPSTASVSLQFESSDPAVATVDERGRITGQAPGDATVTVSANDGAFTQQVAVHVVEKTVYESAANPVQDAYVWQDTVNQNYGQSDELLVKPPYVVTNGGARNSFLEFDFSDYGGTRVERATLRICLKGTDEPFASQYRTINVSPVKEAWDENTITWNTQPSLGVPFTTFLVGRTADEWYEVDLTDYINDNFDSLGGRLSIALSNSTDGADQKSRITFYSGNAAEDKRPQLVLVGEGGEVLPRLQVEQDAAVPDIWADGGVQTDDSLQMALQAGLAKIETDGFTGAPSAAADAALEYDAGEELRAATAGESSITIRFDEAMKGSRSIRDMDVILRTEADSAKQYQLAFYYSTTDSPDDFKLFYEAAGKDSLSFGVEPYIRLSGFDDQVTDVAAVRLVSQAVEGDAPILQEIDLNFTQDDAAVQQARETVRQTLRLPTLFADGMILQRDQTIRVWGWGGKDQVTVKLAAGDGTVVREAQAAVKDGRWLA